MNTERDWSQPIKGSDFTKELARDFLAEMCRRGCGYQWTYCNCDEFADKIEQGVPCISHHFQYRLPPIPRTEPFTQATVPKGALWRETCHRTMWMDWASYTPEEIKFAGGRYAYAGAMYGLEYSTDGGQTWHKAEREVK